MRLGRFVSSALLAAALLPAVASAGTKLLRFPDVHGDQVVFCYGGDLWTASTAGGTATRLTAHPGVELFAQVLARRRAGSPSPASTTATSRSTSCPPTGGEPRQLTFYPARGPLPPRWGYDNQVYGWTPDGTGVLFRSLRDADGGRTENALYTVAARRRPARAAADADARAPATSRPTASASSTRRCSATSAPGSATRAAGRRTSTLRPRDRARSSRSRRACAPSATRCGSATRSTSSPTATARSTSTASTSPSKAVDAAHALEGHGTCAGRARTTAGQIVYELDGELARLRRGDRRDPAARRSACPTTASTAARRASRRPSRSRTSSSRPRASARCSWRAATSSRCRSRRARRAT